MVKDVGWARVLSFLLPGLGMVYAGMMWRGVGFAIGWVVVWGLFWSTFASLFDPTKTVTLSQVVLPVVVVLCYWLLNLVLTDLWASRDEGEAAD